VRVRQSREELYEGFGGEKTAGGGKKVACGVKDVAGGVKRWPAGYIEKNLWEIPWRRFNLGSKMCLAGI